MNDKKQPTVCKILLLAQELKRLNEIMDFLFFRKGL